MNIVLVVLGLIALIDIVATLYICPKCSKDELYYWIPFSFHYRIFSLIAVVVLATNGQPYVIAAILSLFYILNLQSVVRGWAWILDDPFTITRMDIYNIKDRIFKPINPWRLDFAFKLLIAFYDRYAFDLYILTFVIFRLFFIK